MKPDSLICVPGQRLCLLDKEHVAGQGTYERAGYIYATLAGVVDVVEKNGVQVKKLPLFFLLIFITKFVFQVVEVHIPSGENTVVPAQGDIVTAQVTIITQQYCRFVDLKTMRESAIFIDLGVQLNVLVIQF